MARAFISTHEIFVAGRKNNRQRWTRACREVGEILRLLVLAIDEREPDTNVKRWVNEPREHRLGTYDERRVHRDDCATNAGLRWILAFSVELVGGHCNGCRWSALLGRMLFTSLLVKTLRSYGYVAFH